MGYFDNTQTIATEAVFDPELTTQKLLEVAKTNIDAKITTVDAAADLENQLSEEAAEFNGMLTMMNNAIHQCEAGEISKEQCTETCAPCVKALKEKCAALKLADQSVNGDDITEAEIAMLREFIVGCKDLVAAKKQELQDCPITQNAENSSATEGLMSYINNLEPATEGLFTPTVAKQIRNSTQAKTAIELYNNAKKMYRLGSKEKAVESMKKAKGLFEKCLADAKKAGGEKTVERATTIKEVDKTFVDTNKKQKVYSNEEYNKLVSLFEDRIDSCEAYLRLWENKAGKGDVKTLKDELKSERKAEKARIKEEKKAAKEAAKQAESEVAAIESFVDGLMLDLQMDAAMESEGESMIATEAVDIAGKLRNGFNKLKAAVKKGDKAEIEAAQAEIKEGADELASADETADEEGKKKMSTAAKVGLGAAAAVAMGFAATYAIGKHLDNAARAKGQDATESNKKVAALLVKASRGIAAKASDIAAKAGDIKSKMSDAHDYRVAMRAEKAAEKSSAQAQKIANAQAGAQRYEMRQKDKAAAKLNAAAEKAGKKAERQEGRRIAQDQRAKWKAFVAEGDESYTGGVLGMLTAMENDHEDIPLSEVEEDPGKGFDAEAQGEDMIEEAEESLNTLAMESSIDVANLEDGFSLE